MESRQGFTLIELLVVIIIIGILAAIALSKYRESSEQAYKTQMQSDLRQLLSAQEAYRNKYDVYADDMDALVEDGIFKRSEGVTVELETTEGPPIGWNAQAEHVNTDIECVILYDGADGWQQGVVACGSDPVAELQETEVP